MATPGGIARAIDVLRDLNLAEQLEALGVADGGDLELEQPTGRRGRSGLLNEGALSRLADATNEAVRAARSSGHAPLLVGGDCPVILGALAALAAEGRKPGLVMVDGHEDAWPPARSETGEGSDSELAVALGRVVGLPPPLDGWVPLIDPQGVALLGPRDAEELATGDVGSVADEVSVFLDAGEVQRRGGRASMGEALDSLDVEHLWLHVDLDVLCTEDFAAVDYRQLAGLAWSTLDELIGHALADSRCAGMSVVIYNPDLDTERRDGRKLIDFVLRSIGEC